MKNVLLLTILFLLVLPKINAEDKKQPNIVLILADDLGWRDLSCMGSNYYETPAIDQLAADGLLFTDAYAAAPVCLPTRASLMTGKTPARLNMTAVFDRDRGEMPLVPPDWNNSLPHEEYTIAERLKDNGYKTAIMGKWHLVGDDTYWPKNHGFDVNVGAWKSGRPDSYFPPYNNPMLPDGPEGEYLTDRLAREAVKFIQENSKEPFFLYLPFYNPHSPIEAPQETIDRFINKPPDGDQKSPEYAAMIAHLDLAVENIMKTLNEEGIAENTLVIFTSDNGGVKTIWDLEITDNAPLRAEKFLLYEGGIRVPLIVKWPGKTPVGEKTSQMAYTTDLLPTLMSAIGQPVFEPDLDGVDLTPVLKNGDSAWFPRMLAWHYPHYMPRQNMKPSSAIRAGDYKLIHWHESHQIELYNLADDIGEQNNLAPEMPEKALELYDKLNNWRNRVNAQMPRPNPQYVKN